MKEGRGEGEGEKRRYMVALLSFVAPPVAAEPAEDAKPSEPETPLFTKATEAATERTAEPEDKAHFCVQFLDRDGLPFVGVRVSPGDPVAAYIDETTGRTNMVKYKGDEVAYVEEVRLLG